MHKNYITNCDCLELLKGLNDDFIDLVVTSPPYDNMRSYGGVIDQWNEDKFKAIAKELARTLKDGGVIVWIVADQTINGSESGSSFKQALFFKEIGLNIHDTMIWRKVNPMPNNQGKRYFNSFEYMFVFSKGTPKTFNPIMEKCKLVGTKVKAGHTHLDIKEKRKMNRDFIVKEERYKYNVWDIAVSANKTIHTAAFPLKLAEDHVSTWSNKGDLVFDPFLGSGTTVVAAIELERNFIGCELNKDYYNESIKRIENKINEINSNLKSVA